MRNVLRINDPKVINFQKKSSFGFFPFLPIYLDHIPFRGSFLGIEFKEFHKNFSKRVNEIY